MYKPFSPYSDYTGDVQDPIRVRVLKLFERGWRFINLGRHCVLILKDSGICSQSKLRGQDVGGESNEYRTVLFIVGRRYVLYHVWNYVYNPPPPQQLSRPPQSPVSIIECVAAVCYFQSMWFVTFRVEFILSPPPPTFKAPLAGRVSQFVIYMC